MDLELISSLLRNYLLITIAFCLLKVLGFLLAKDRSFLVWIFMGCYVSFAAVAAGTWNIIDDGSGAPAYVINHLSCIDVPFTFLVGPFTFVMIRETLHPIERNRKKYIIHFISSILAILLMIPFYLLPAEAKALKPQSAFQNPQFLLQDILLLLPILMFPPYLIYFSRKIIPAWRYVNAGSEERTAVRVLSLPFVGLLITTIFLLSYYVFFERILVRAGISVFGSMILFEFFMGYRYPNFSQSFLTVMKDSNRRFKHLLLEPASRPLLLNRGKQATLAENLERLMLEERVYQEPDISLDELARLAGVNRGQLSEYLNKILGKNFTRYVNEYRVRAAQELLVQNQEISITDVVFSSGFNSIPTFNRVFASLAGRSPTAFREELQEPALM